MNRALLLVGSLFVLVGCGDSNAELDEQHAIWDSKRPSDYVIRVCGRGHTAPGCTVDAVSGQDVVASISRFGNDEWTESDPSEREEPVERLFRRARAEGRCDRDRLEFDGRFGFVNDYYFDCGEEGSGEQVTCFVADSLDLSVCQGD